MQDICREILAEGFGIQFKFFQCTTKNLVEIAIVQELRKRTTFTIDQEVLCIYLESLQTVQTGEKCTKEESNSYACESGNNGT